MSRRRSSPGPLALSLLATLAAFGGCVLLEPYDELAPDPTLTTSTSTGGGGGSTSTSTTGGGAGGMAQGGGGAGGGPPLCQSGDTQPCYSGPAGTQGVGICAAGLQTCSMGAFGPCVGEVLPAVEDCATQADDDCNGTAPACPGGHLASLRYGNASDQQANAITVAPNGDVAVVGKLAGAGTFGATNLTSAGGGDALLFVTDANLVPKWAKVFGDSLEQGLNAVDTDSLGNYLVAGEFKGTIDFGAGPFTSFSANTNDVTIAKFDANGAGLWSHKYGANFEDVATAIAVDGGDNVIITGYYSNTIVFGAQTLTNAGGFEVFVAKHNSAGGVVWAVRAGDALDQKAVAIVTDAANNIYITGRFTGTMTAGVTTVTSMGGDDIFLAKLDSAGNWVWLKSFGGSVQEQPGDIAVDSQGNVLITGRFQGSVDFGSGVALNSPGQASIFVAKYTSNGAHISSKVFGDPNNQYGTALAMGPLDVVYLGATNFGTVPLGAGIATAGSSDAFVAKFDSQLSNLWAEGFGDALAQSVTGLAVGPAGELYLSGDVAGSFTLPGGPLLSGAADTDGLLVKLAP